MIKTEDLLRSMWDREWNNDDLVTWADCAEGRLIQIQNGYNDHLAKDFWKYPKRYIKVPIVSWERDRKIAASFIVMKGLAIEKENLLCGEVTNYINEFMPEKLEEWERYKTSQATVILQPTLERIRHCEEYPEG
jgi:hypothetical protein